MFTNLSKTTLLEHQIMIRSQRVGAILERMPTFLKSLSTNPKTAGCISNYEKNLKKSIIIEQDNMSEAIEWIQDKISKLKESPFANYFLCVRSIKRLEEGLHKIQKDSSIFHLDIILINFKYAVSLFASFGRDSILDTWVKMELENCPSHWQYEDEESRPNQPFPPLYVKSLKIHYPQCINDILLKKSKGEIIKWKDRQEVDSTIMYSFLKMLSKYSDFKSGVKPLLINPTIEEKEILCVQGEVGAYLDQFLSNDLDEHPLTRDQIIDFVEIFLRMLELEINKKTQNLKTNKTPSNDPRVKDKITVIDWMKNKWKADKDITHASMAFRAITAISNRQIALSKEYERSTLEKWAKDADPCTKLDKLRRPKGKNIKKRGTQI